MNRLYSRCCLFLAALLVSINAVGQEEATDQHNTMAEGLKAFDEGEYESAAQLLLEDLKRNPWPTSAYYAGLSLEKLGRLLEAAELYQKALDLEPPTDPAEVAQMQKRAQEKAKKQLAEVNRRIPSLTLRLEGAAPQDVAVTVDDVPVPASSLGKPVPLDPGRHHVRGRCGDEVVKPPAVKLDEEAKQEIVLRFECGKPKPAGAPKPPRKLPEAERNGESSSNSVRTLGWIAVGAGSAGVALWGAAGTFGLVRLRSLKDEGCDESSHCYPSQRKDVDRYRLARTLSTVGFYAGVPLLAVGAGTLLWTSGRAEGGAETASVSAWMGPGSAGLSGRF
ncbi:MAG: tetratricopeptide repeat protein [Polyangiaceae bacterium]|nr:tetratricopeptide repeat protein [Polyangiaceae bacterium]